MRFSSVKKGARQATGTSDKVKRDFDPFYLSPSNRSEFRKSKMMRDFEKVNLRDLKGKAKISPQRIPLTIGIRRARSNSHDAAFGEYSSDGISKSLRSVLGSRKRRSNCAPPREKKIKVGVIVGESDALDASKTQSANAFDFTEENGSKEWVRICEKRQNQKVFKGDIKIIWKYLRSIVKIRPKGRKIKQFKLERANGRLV